MRPPSVRLNLPTQSQSVSPSTVAVTVAAASGDPLTKPPPSPISPSLSTSNLITLNKTSNPATQSSLLVHNRPEETMMDAPVFNVSGSEPIKQLMVIRLDI